MTALTKCRVQRYGHFEDITVEFGTGCTVVYGENEAGKSTLLDALGDFLWGFPARNHPREFVYKRNQMLLEGTVELDGAHLYTRQPTRLTCDGVEITAAPWGVDLNRLHWDHAYGLNLARLEKGGRSIVSGHDDPGGISFLADTGLPIDEVMEKLVERRNELFAAHAGNKKSAIRQLLTRLQELDDRIEAAGASAKDVEDLQQQLHRLKSSLRENKSKMAGVDDEIRVVQELLRAFDDVTRLQQLDDQITELKSSGPVLDEEATEALELALNNRTTISNTIADLTDNLEAARSQLAGIAPRQDVLDRTADIRAAVREHDARRTDAAVLLDTSAAANYRHEVTNLLDSLGQDTDDLLAARQDVSVPVDRHEQLDRLADSWEAARAVLETQRQKVREAEARLEQESAPAAGSETLVAQLAHRDEAWRAVREPWISGDLPDATVRVELATRLDTAIERADAEAERAAAALEQLGVSRGKRQEAEAALAREQAHLSEAEVAEQAAHTDWVTLVEVSDLPTGLDPKAWQVRAALLNRLTVAWQKWHEEEARHQAARERYDDFQARVAGLAVLLPSPTGDALTDINALDQLLNDAEDIEIALRTGREVMESAVAELAAAQASLAQSAATIDRLAVDAEPAELLERSVTAHQLTSNRAATAQLITAATPSIPSLEDVLTVLGGRERASLQALEAELDSQRIALSAAVDEESEAVGGTQTELSALQNKEGTAALLAERQEVAARIADLAEQYRNLHIQELILHSYAKLNADRSDTPILDRAGTYLNTLTGGRHQGFSVITIGADKHLRIKSLVGDTIQDTEPAKLSNGTEHQVYFALRLAGIAARQEERRRKGLPTVPVVLDDVFQAFDDERSTTALQLLAELGRDFQIIVMTHEEAIFNTAETMPGVDTVRLAAPRVPTSV